MLRLKLNVLVKEATGVVPILFLDLTVCPLCKCVFHIRGNCEYNSSVIMRNIYHYNDVVMRAIASQITSLTIVYSTVYSDEDRRKHQSSVSLVIFKSIILSIKQPLRCNCRFQGPYPTLGIWKPSQNSFYNHEQNYFR